MEVQNAQYPDKMLRGISSKNYIQEGAITDEVFPLTDYREDGFFEISVTWYDEPHALDVIMEQRSERRNGDIQFPGGIAEIDRNKMCSVLKIHFINNWLNYERRATKNNPYHGNILVKRDISTQMKRLIRCTLASLANEKIYPNTYVKK